MAKPHNRRREPQEDAVEALAQRCKLLLYSHGADAVLCVLPFVAHEGKFATLPWSECEVAKGTLGLVEFRAADVLATIQRRA